MTQSNRAAPASPPEAGPIFRLHWPDPGPEQAWDNFFVGAWHRSGSLAVECTNAPGLAVGNCHGRNWFLAGALHPSAPAGLVHADPGGGAVAFRGYALPALHSYSAEPAILSHWLNAPAQTMGGVFSVAMIARDGTALTLSCDTLGMGTLYWRELDNVVLFSTNARYLACEGDLPDLLAWRCLVQASWITSDRSLTRDVHRVPAGTSVRFSGRATVVGRSAIETLPEGTRNLDHGTLEEIEETFQQGLDRCLQFSDGGLMLPLSSGYDSRRILAGLMERKATFNAVTCRVVQTEHRDLDARYAGAMAQELGFPHTVVEASRARYLADDVTRRLLLDAECTEHTWSLPVVRATDVEYGAMFDGIAGDVLGDPVGWFEQTNLTPAASEAVGDLNAIVEHAIGTEFDTVLAADAWPSVDAVRQDLQAYLKPLQGRPNMSELSFLLLRQRRGVALWSQQLPPPGTVPLYPYLDPDYLRLMLSISSDAKRRISVQGACLKEFWPQYFRFPGTRAIPANLEAKLPTTEEANSAACHQQLRREIGESQGASVLRGLLTRKGAAALAVQRLAPGLAPRWAWYSKPLLELVSRQTRMAAVWRPVT